MTRLKPITTSTVAAVPMPCLLSESMAAMYEAPGKLEQDPDHERVPGRALAQLTLPARRRLVLAGLTLACAARPAALVAPGPDHERGEKDERADAHVEDRIDRVLGRARATRSAEGEDEDEAERDARDHRPGEIAGQQLLRAEQGQHHGDGGQQGGIERSGQRQGENASHGRQLSRTRRPGSIIRSG